MISNSWINSSDIAVEILSRSEVVGAAARRLGAALRAVAGWLADEAYTPTTGPAPYVSPARHGAWSGVIVIHKNRPVTWLLLRSDSVLDEREAPHTQPGHTGFEMTDEEMYLDEGPYEWPPHR